MKLAAALSALFLISFGGKAHAYTECTSTLEKIWVGDDGHVWLFFTNGGAAHVLPGDGDREAILSLATTARVSRLQLTARYAEDGLSCTSWSGTLTGVFL